MATVIIAAVAFLVCTPTADAGLIHGAGRIVSGIGRSAGRVANGAGRVLLGRHQQVNVRVVAPAKVVVKTCVSGQCEAGK